MLDPGWLVKEFSKTLYKDFAVKPISWVSISSPEIDQFQAQNRLHFAPVKRIADKPMQDMTLADYRTCIAAMARPYEF